MSSVPQSANVDAQLLQLKVPPHSIEAEQSVLGGLMIDNGAIDKVGDMLVEADFYRDEDRKSTRLNSSH